MGLLRIDGHCALVADDAVINSTLKAIQSRLAIHAERDGVFFQLVARGRGVPAWAGRLPEFVILPGTQLSVEVSGSKLDQGVLDLLTSDGETRSPHITYDLASDTFERFGASQTW
ncbi:hypothetical protein AYX19_09985 [Paenarthrobacter ureafaciens]|nr:hypothetical protein AYX19_09985 [Paenarthrobacter ureafaciens]